VRTRVAARCVGAVVGLTALVAGAAPAGATGSPSYVVMYSDTGDYIGGGVQRVFDSANAAIAVSGSPGYLTVSVSGGTLGDYYDFDFAAPPGQVLVSGGVYVDAQRAPFREAGHPGIDISGSGRGCNTDSGLFEVKDIAVSGGAISRLWIVYEQHCEGGGAATWGELRLGEPTAGAPLIAPGIVRWSATDIGRPSTVVPVSVVALAGPTSITNAAVVGTAASDFVVRSNECSGKSLAVGGRCQVWMRFVPTAAGTRIATLRLTDGGGTPHDIALQGFAYGGRTHLDMKSDAGDYIGAGKTWSYTLASSQISMGGSHSYAGFGIDGADGSWWYGDFSPGQGDILVAGSTYPDAHRYPFSGTGPGLDISGNGRGCNTLTGSFAVTWTDFGADGRLRSLGVTFEQHCEGATPALRGTFEFRAGDNTPPAPWMTGSTPAPSAPTIVVFGPASGSPGTSVTISGTNFTSATSVTFAGAAASFSVSSATQINATVPSGATTGRIAVTTPGGSATSTDDFTVTAAPPPTTTTTVTTTIATTMATTNSTTTIFTTTTPTTTVITTIPVTTTAPGTTVSATAPGTTVTGPTTIVTTPSAPLIPAPRRLDVTPPNTLITAGPTRLTNARRAKFRFVATESHTTFQCRLDTRRWTPCKSPKAYESLARGRHCLLVRAGDRAGNVDPTPAWRVWRVR
jgi:hypothetical protein